MHRRFALRVAGAVFLAHTLGMIWLFLSIHKDPDGEAIMGWNLFRQLDWPSSLGRDIADRALWRNEMLWYDESSGFNRAAKRLRVDHLNAGEFVLVFIVGSR